MVMYKENPTLNDIAQEFISKFELDKYLDESCPFGKKLYDTICKLISVSNIDFNNVLFSNNNLNKQIRIF